jgi:hypothetical protein
MDFVIKKQTESQRIGELSRNNRKNRDYLPSLSLFKLNN